MMITRIVKLTFQEEKTDDFLQIFEESKESIRQFPGCRHLELWREKKDLSVFFTYSCWESEEKLNRYRESEVFRQTWSRTRALFAKKPQAWSLEKIACLD